MIERQVRLEPTDTVTVVVEAVDNPLVPHETGGPYVERFWLPILGPTGVALLRLGAGCSQPLHASAEDLSSSLGIQTRALCRTLSRLHAFKTGVWWEAQNTLLVPSHLGWLPTRLLARLPVNMQAVHRQLREAA